MQIKTLFLLLQVLFDLQQPEPARPVLFLLDVKLIEQKAIIAQKRQIKNLSPHLPAEQRPK